MTLRWVQGCCSGGQAIHSMGTATILLGLLLQLLGAACNGAKGNRHCSWFADLFAIELDA